MQVESPAVFPQACFCGSAKGPLVDTFVTTAGNRIYVCASCVKSCAKQLGLVKGERMEELLNAGALLDAARKDLAERDALIESQMGDLAGRARKIDALEELLQQARDRDKTRQHLIEMQHELSGQLLGVGG